MIRSDDILHFWFVESGFDDWFTRSPAFDETIRQRFADATERAAAGDHDGWRETACGCVALCILLDQFPRNLHRGSPAAFAHDQKALAVSLDALERGLDLADELSPEQRAFLYMPLMHQEDADCQRRCLSLMRQRVGIADYIGAAERHLEIIERFGRFPHRNAVLGRASTEEELAFLKEPRSSF